jgi:hypothetical protein
MKPRIRSLLLTISCSFCGLVPFAAAQHTVQANQARSGSCASGDSSSSVAIHAAQHNTPYLNLCDGRTLARVGASALGAAQPLALASGDFDEDGVPDLVSGFSSGKSGLITVHRGNVNALWPYGAALRNGTPAAFLPNPRQFSLPEAPDFVAAAFSILSCRFVSPAWCRRSFWAVRSWAFRAAQPGQNNWRCCLRRPYSESWID